MQLFALTENLWVSLQHPRRHAASFARMILALRRHGNASSTPPPPGLTDGTRGDRGTCISLPSRADGAPSPGAALAFPALHTGAALLRWENGAGLDQVPSSNV